jgi:hypothetical protein
MLLIFIFTTIYTWTAFPFTSGAPFKLMFKQTVFLQPRERYPGRYPNKVEGVLTTLTGLEDVLKNRIIPELPSASIAKQISCVPSTLYPGLHDCSWQTPSSLIPDNGARPRGPWYPPTWMTVTATSLGLNKSRVSVAGYNSRNCRLYFDNQNATSFLVEGANTDRKMQVRYPISDLGTNQIRLWSRTWNRVFFVEVEHPQWPRRGLRARAACDWNEYESGIIGMDNDPKSGRTHGKIPAYEEVLRWLPKWAVVVKADDGLVEAVQEINI